jgi:UTP--glucose-1-phosphate uridylyltransferase
MTPIRKAVFPVAGLGTRFLPATKAMPKEMLTVVDRPLIQHVVDEARAAGIEHLIFVTGRNKGVIEDHFDLQYELEQTLAARGKKPELSILAEAQPAAGRDIVHAPAGAARLGPRGVVRARTGRTRARSRSCSRTC